LIDINRSQAAVSKRSSTALPAAEDRRAIRLRDVGDHPAALLFQHVGDDDFGALAGKDARHAGAHPGRRTGDQRDLVF
jgi:hypothetical protein